MPDVPYLIAGVVIAALITVALRAVPFAVLKPLRKSKLVQALGRWMPAGILLILVVVLTRDQIRAHPGDIAALGISMVVTVVVHLVGRRRAYLSIAAGTACYVLLLNFF